MTRVRFIAIAGLLSVLAFAYGPAAAAEPHAFRLHVQGHLGSGPSSLDLDVPWDCNDGESPFDFTRDACDDVGLERLRGAWSELSRMPEGQSVMIRTDSESIRAWKEAGYLVLEPRHRDDRDEHHSRVKLPDYIVGSILDHDGRLTNRDIQRLVRERGKVTLVKLSSDLGGGTVWVDRAKPDDD